MQRMHSERAADAGSCLCRACMKTTPELCAEGSRRSVTVQLRYKQRVKNKVEPCESTLRCVYAYQRVFICSEERNQATAKLAGFSSLKEERNQATAKHTVQDQERKRKW